MANGIEESSNATVIDENTGLTINIDGPIIIAKDGSSIEDLLRKAMLAPEEETSSSKDESLMALFARSRAPTRPSSP